MVDENFLIKSKTFVADYSFITGEYSNIDSLIDSNCMVHYNYKTLVRGYKHYELSNHLGNVLAVISDKRITLCASSVVSGYEADVISASDYYPFGMLMSDRTYSSPVYRYGFNGQEKMDEISVGGGNYDCGARIYDSRLGRWQSLDPETTKGPQFAPYSFSFNNPLLYIDEDGRWAVYVHYKMTRRALMKAGISKNTAKQIAHYASTYADNPGGIALFGNKVLGVFAGVNPKSLSKNESKYGVYDKTGSQNDDDKNVIIHAMKAYFENISDEEAVDRALNGGTFTDQNGNSVVVEGALNIIKRFKGVDLDKLTEAQKKELGLAFHMIQDSEAHKGGRWVKQHKKMAKEEGKEKRHSFFRDIFGGNGGLRNSRQESKKAAETLKGEE